ncbi:serpin-type proteinase inhibitor19 [Vairimorpha necatrix]|uniref:Serpin-type proteinase inhibitor19 n=1 Tax=Vairimorpha necatrix TaxID=6039 RepID=A0AAX4JEI5_9MICR
MGEFGQQILKTSYEIFNCLLQQEKGTFVVSPFSIINMLGILLNGSNDTLKNKMKKILGNTVDFNNDISKIYNQLKISLEDLNSATLNLNNYVFHDMRMKVLPDFRETLARYLISELKPVYLALFDDFQNLINKTVYTDTNGLLDKISDDLPDDLKVLILNTVYFKESWRFPFSVDHENEYFFNGDKKFKVPMMKIRKKFKAADTEKFKVVQIPFANPTYSFLGILPKTNNFSNIRISDVLSSLKLHDVFISMPKFTIETEIDIKDKLKLENLQGIFDGHSFLNIFKDTAITNPELIHVAVIDIDEKGTSASTVTYEYAITCLLHPKEIIFEFNSPFLFYIIKTITNNSSHNNFKQLPIIMGRYTGHDMNK